MKSIKTCHFLTIKQEFNVYKNMLCRLINQAKNIYLSTQFEKKNRGDGKKTWQTIDNALHRKKNNINT